MLQKRKEISAGEKVFSEWVPWNDWMKEDDTDNLKISVRAAKIQ